jgi:hypothetical protein
MAPPVRKCCEATEAASAPNNVAPRHFLDVASTPPLQGELSLSQPIRFTAS